MTQLSIIHRTTDGREFEDVKAAETHQNLLNAVETFMDEHGIGETRRRKTRQLLVDWTTQAKTTDFSAASREVSE